MPISTIPASPPPPPPGTGGHPALDDDILREDGADSAPPRHADESDSEASPSGSRHEDVPVIPQPFVP